MTTISLEKIKAFVASAEENLGKVNKGNKAARVRLRNDMQGIKVEAQAVRIQVSGLTDTL